MEFLGAGDDQWRIEKRDTTNGSLDSVFGSGGVEQSNPTGGLDQAVLIATDGSDLYVGGFRFTGTPGDFGGRIEKRNLGSGNLDGTFGGGNGFVHINPSTNPGIELAAVFIDSGNLYTGGNDYSPGAGNAQWRISRLNTTTGLVDTGFGIGGVLTVNPSANEDTPEWVVFDATAFYVVGSDRSLGASNSQWRIQKHTK